MQAAGVTACGLESDDAAPPIGANMSRALPEEAPFVEHFETVQAR